jgi:hypothetical protein
MATAISYDRQRESLFRASMPSPLLQPEARVQPTKVVGGAALSRFGIRIPLIRRPIGSVQQHRLATRGCAPRRLGQAAVDAEISKCVTAGLAWFSPTVSLILLDRPVPRASTAWASWQDMNQGACEADTQRGDRVRYVALRTQRQLLRVDKRREGQIAGLARRWEVLRGESSPFRRPGIRRPQCIDLRGGESRASRVLRSGRAQLLA